MREHRLRAVLFFALGMVLIGALLIALPTLSYAEPAAVTNPAEVTPPADATLDATAPTDATTNSLPTGGLVPTDGSVIPSSGPASPTDPNAVQMFADKTGCLSCHGDPALKNLMTYTRPDGSTIELYVDTKGSANSVHRYKDCTSCHTMTPHEVKTPLTKLSLSQKCGTCHDYEYEQHKKSIHGVPLQNGNSDPATCTDCHSETSNPHNVVRVLDPSASTYPKNVANTCAKCHDNPRLMDKYGIVEKVYASYMRSFHGKAMKLSPESAAIQQLDTATCTNCHGAHNIKEISNPSASVAGMDNLLETCQTCHPNAGPEFVKGFLGHKAVNSDSFPQVYWGGRAFYVFSRAMLAGGMLIVAGSISLRGVPWITRRIRRSKKKGD